MINVNYEENKITIKYDVDKINSSRVVGWLMDKAETRDIKIEGTQIEDVIRRMYRTQTKR